MPEQITEVYGYSDDLATFKGAINAEMPCYHGDAEAWFLALSDGTVLRLVYDQHSIWRLDRLRQGACGHSHQPARLDGDNCTNDVVTLTGPLTWVVLGDEMATA